MIDHPTHRAWTRGPSHVCPVRVVGCNDMAQRDKLFADHAPLSVHGGDFLPRLGKEQLALDLTRRQHSEQGKLRVL